MWHSGIGGKALEMKCDEMQLEMEMHEPVDSRLFKALYDGMIIVVVGFSDGMLRV